MALPEFIEGVRIAAGFLSPEVWSDGGNQSPDEMARSLQLADIWLTPAAVKNFSADDFVSLLPDERERLSVAVNQFRAVAGTVPPDAPASQAQVAEALPHFLTILEILRPYLADPDAIAVRRAIWRACYGHREWIPSFDFRLDEDSDGAPAVWVWFIINPDVDVRSRAVQLRLFEVRNEIRKNLAEAGIRRHLYGSVWGRDEVAPLVLGGGRA